MIIREIEEKDYDNLSALAIYVWLHTYANSGIRDKISNFVLQNFSPNKFEKLKNSSNAKVIVAIKDEHLIGFITVDSNSQFRNSEIFGYEIKTLYVHPIFQKQGLGKLLVNHAVEHHGPKLWLSTWVYNESALRFYDKIRFKKVGTTIFDLFGESHQNIVLSNNYNT